MQPDDLAVKLIGRCVSSPSFSATVALGVRGFPRASHTAWVVVNVADGCVADTASTLLDSQSSILLERTLDVAVGISARPDAWDKVAAGGRAAVLELAASRDFYVVGEAPFFIRHLGSIVDLLTCVGSKG